MAKTKKVVPAPKSGEKSEKAKSKYQIIAGKKVLIAASGIALLISALFLSGSLFIGTGVGVAALVLFGTGGQLIGSVGGTTYQRGRYGAVARMKTSPVQPNSAAQTQRRNFTSASSTAWKYLTAEERAGWDLLAQSFPVTNRFGQEVFLTSQAFFNSVNMTLQSIGEDIMTTPVPPDMWVVPSAELSVVLAAGDGLTTFVALDPTAFGIGLIVQATRPLPSTVNVGSLGREWRTIFGGERSAANAATINAAYLTKFGIGLNNEDYFPEGARVFFRIRMIDIDANASGASSPWLVSDWNVTA